MSNLNKTEDIGTIVKNERKVQGLTQEDLAGLSGTGRRFISELEGGKPTVQLGKVLLVIGALGLSFAILNSWNKKE